MSKNFSRILSELNNYPEFRLSIITNGTLICLKSLQDIIKIRPSIMFQISLDGLKEHHDIIRGEGCFNKTMNCIELLRNNMVPFYFHTLIHKYNYNEINDIIDFARNSGAYMLDFTFLKKKGRGKTNYNDLSLPIDQQVALIQRMNIEKYKLSSEKFIINFPSVFYGICPIFTDDKQSDVFARIDVNGNVFACQNFEGTCNALGNILIEDISEIVTDERIAHQKEMLKKNAENLPCSSCIINSFCGKGCPGIELSDPNDSMYGIDCELRRHYARDLLFKI